MADAISTITMQTGKHYIVRRVCDSDGTGESDAILLDISTLTNANGVVPTRTRIKEIWYDIQGFSSITLKWDHTTDDTIGIFSGGGYLDLHAVGGLLDPASAGGTGDILITTAGATATASYTLVLVVELI